MLNGFIVVFLSAGQRQLQSRHLEFILETAEGLMFVSLSAGQWQATILEATWVYFSQYEAKHLSHSFPFVDVSKHVLEPLMLYCTYQILHRFI